MKVVVTGSSDGRIYPRLVHGLQGFDVSAVGAGDLVEACQGADVLVSFGGSWNREVLSKLPISLLQRFGVGVDNVDLAAADELGIWIANVPSLPSDNADSVADMVLLLLLMVYRRISEAQKAMQTGNWAVEPGRTLKGKTACLVGMGGIGLSAAVRLQACGMKLLGVRRNPHKTVPEELHFEEVFGPDRLHWALSKSDVVILSATTDEETRGMMGEDEFAIMPEGSVVVNVGRGGLIRQDALVKALQTGHLGGAGLDVFDKEPLDPAHPLLRLPNVVATPHLAGTTHEALRGIGDYIVENIRTFLAGHRLASIVNDPPNPRRPLR
ncbi:MAG TPA: NAD(P)-dependent oxidoreductase [Fimbriimonas sp.]|nr:NAD(P)-dependent oxidoreductase [Fimbriimonas sp.]